jgi:hypothetical protein
MPKIIGKAVSKILNQINLYQYRNGKWVLEITLNGSLYYLVSFDNVIDALQQRANIETNFFDNNNMTTQNQQEENITRT